MHNFIDISKIFKLLEKIIYVCYNLTDMDTREYEKIIRCRYGQKFEIFKDMLLEYNNKFNLTAITDENGVYIKHFLDSVMGESFIPQGADVVEVGSGGGFPSIPLKIIRDDLKFTLIESTGKKCSYLQTVVDKLGLEGVNVLNARAEDVAKQVMHREKYGVAVARAVAKLNTLCEYCLPLVKPGGAFIAYKSDVSEELEIAKRAITVLGGQTEKVEEYFLPNGEKRVIVVIRKLSHTPEKYPRGQGKERKNPIV